MDIRRRSKKQHGKIPSSFRLLKTSVVYQGKEFFNNSTLHGVRYIAENRPILEKLMWFCFVLTGAISSIVIIFSLWEKFQTNPTITGLDTDFHNQEVTFPTIMVCPVQPYDDNATKDLALSWLSSKEPESNDTSGIEEFLKDLSRVSYTYMKTIDKYRNDMLDDSGFAKKDIRKIIFMVAKKCNSTFALCKYKDEEITCCEFFKPVFNEHGFCFSFNSRYYDLEDSEERNNIMHNLFETDKKWSISMALLAESQVFVHSYNETSGWDFKPQVLWDINYVVELLITMKETYTTLDAKLLSIGQRKCIFPDEKSMTYYKDEYTFSGCMKECRINKCLKFCKCLPPFYKPAKTPNYCDLQGLKCLSKYLNNITGINDCQHCELGCQNIVYDIEKYSKVLKTDGEQSQDAFITIEYLTWPIIRFKREVLFGWIDLLVSFGGIAGLFLGFSLLSGVEIIYYFTMRAFCMIYKDKEELIRIEQQKQTKAPKVYNVQLKPTVSKSKVGPIKIVTPKTGNLVYTKARADRMDKIKALSKETFSRSIQVIPYNEKLFSDVKYYYP